MIKLHFIILFPLISFKEPFIFDFSLEKIQMINVAYCILAWPHGTFRVAF